MSSDGSFWGVSVPPPTPRVSRWAGQGPLSPKKMPGLSTIPSPEAERCVEELRALTATGAVQAQLQVEDWVMQNNARFLGNLSLELKRVERIIREHLQKLGYRTIHVDLEPW